jgi:L-aspartate oxidase
MSNRPQSQHGERKQFDVIVIGSGIAGLSFALELAEKQPEKSIAIIAKKQLSESNSFYAQGGMAAVTEDYDSIAKHFEDTVKAGAGLCSETVVKQILEHGKQAIQDLIARGVKFSEEKNKFALAREGGHSERRVFNAGDHTGAVIIEALIKAVKKLKQVRFLEFHTAVELITQSQPHLPGDRKEVVGTYVLNEATGKIDTCLANLVVLATGGAGKVFRYTSNPETATGDGIAMAYRAGARVGNLEFYQFHPTLLFHRELNNFLISETLRGEGAYLLNAETKERFMQDYAPEQMELATRDVVAKAIFTEIEKSSENFVYLDIRHVAKNKLLKTFPIIYDTLAKLGIHMEKDLIPVVPAAHYLCGGILADTCGQTDLKRLYAIGETAFTGLHGANRLASNSLLEGAVTGKLAAQQAQAVIAEPVKLHRAVKDWDSKHVTDLRRASQINALWRGLRGEMTSFAGIVRTEAGLKDLLKLILTRREMIEDYYRKHTITRDVIELRNIILVAKLMVNSALYRKESRGGHYREDFPKTKKRNADTILRAKDIGFNF